jgi:hypothetical protein
LSFGAEDDPNRANVYNWQQVDDLGGLSPLWAGVYNGTIYLHAGAEPPTNAKDDNTDLTGAPIADGIQVWKNAEPVQPLMPVPMSDREQMLKNENGLWRRLTWEPIALFDVSPHKASYNSEGVLTIERYSIYAVVEYPFVALYTTHTLVAGETQADGQPARWPFSHYGRLLKEGQSETYGPTSSDGGTVSGWYAGYTGYRLAPLPWQNGNGELESVSDFEPSDGVQAGQYYAMPPQYPCGRYLSQMGDRRISESLEAAYVAAANAKNDGDEVYAFEKITQAAAREAIIEPIQTAATERYSIDPALMEEQKRPFPEGAQEGALWQVDPPPYHVVFALHLAEEDDRWPHWLALMACDAPTAVLTASACAWYNDFRPAGGWPDDESGSLPAPDPNDPDDVAPGDEEDDEGGSSSSGGVTPDDPNGSDEDDPETDEDIPDDGGGTPEKHAGYYYRAGDGVTIRADWQPSLEGWRFTVSINAIEIKGSVDYTATLTAVTGNDDQIYDSVYGDGLSMFYGVSVQDSSPSSIVVQWKSSGPPNDGQDNLPKETTASADGTCSVAVNVSFEALQLTSKSSPSPFGNILQATADGTITKRFSRRVWDSVTQRYKLERIAVTYTVYRLQLNPAMYKWLDAYYVMQAPTLTNFAVDAKTTDPDCSAADNYIQGYSYGLTGPNVAAVNGDASPVEESPEAVTLYGGFSAVAYMNYELKASYSVSGGSSWDAHGRVSGRINGRFEATYKENIVRSIKF